MEDRRIAELIDFTRKKFGLKNYYLKRRQLCRRVNYLNETIYTLDMEWFPDHVVELGEDGTNPPGTAVIEIEIHTRKVTSVIFVMGKTYASEGIHISGQYKEEVIGWVEQETGLVYGEQFHLDKEEEGELIFKGSINGIKVYPGGIIEIKFNKEGKLTFFAVHGYFPSVELVRKETFTLTRNELMHLAHNQFKLVRFPSHERKKLFAVYAMDEVFITNHTMALILFDVLADVSAYVKIDEVLYWDNPVRQPFIRKEINWLESISTAQAFSSEPSPDSFPITEQEQEQCMEAVKKMMSQEYPNESGRWFVETLHRERGYIQAILTKDGDDCLVFKSKLLIMIDRNFQAINYMDNREMFKIYEGFELPDKIEISKEQAYGKLKGLLELEPYYVYDQEQKKYVLCGLLDCHYSVDASTGEVIALNDL
ncbi:hypothetical protein [Sediminibacillus massiliensis]|uniref:hypothetical protein n=1 Tax=Sediminibacillus massiliensis TaxID=1926277 RepID=UPI001FE83238|nr:hypothetical protein [Sediminibacillus massiliensis]